jgi:NAD(P)-dependent dehydrogenase (short-subunit alcohol dehydrogenase family)
VAIRAAQAGADVVLAARTESFLAEVAGKVTAAGRRALVVPADITDDGACERLAEAAVAEFGRVDTLVNNAFAMPPMRSLGKVDLEDLRDNFDVNVLGALRLTRLFTPALVASGGSIVMINSAVLRHSRRPFGPYKMAKASLLAISQNLASELGPQGVRVNSVAPGWIWADSLRWWFDFQAGKRGVPAQEIYDEVAATTDLRRLPEPDEVADAVLFLASDLARAVTGQCLDVNCGEFHH